MECSATKSNNRCVEMCFVMVFVSLQSRWSHKQRLNSHAVFKGLTTYVCCCGWPVKSLAEVEMKKDLFKHRYLQKH